VDPKLLKALYSPPAGRVVVVTVPKEKCLLVAGSGPPSGPAFQQAIAALYGTTYTMKFMYPKGHPLRDTRVRPLEGLYRLPGRKRFGLASADKLLWTLLIPQPAAATARTVKAAMARLKEKKSPPGIGRLRFERIGDGPAIQTMHVGPYTEEQRTIDLLERFAREQGFRITGPHHEVYLGDPRRTRPEKLKTVLRYAVTKKA
jgi:hypothetical protein